MRDERRGGVDYFQFARGGNDLASRRRRKAGGGELCDRLSGPIAADIHDGAEGRLGKLRVGLFVERDLTEDIHRLWIFLAPEGFDELAADRGLGLSREARAQRGGRGLLGGLQQGTRSCGSLIPATSAHGNSGR